MFSSLKISVIANTGEWSCWKSNFFPTQNYQWHLAWFSKSSTKAFLSFIAGNFNKNISKINLVKEVFFIHWFMLYMNQISIGSSKKKKIKSLLIGIYILYILYIHTHRYIYIYIYLSIYLSLYIYIRIKI